MLVPSKSIRNTFIIISTILVIFIAFSCRQSSGGESGAEEGPAQNRELFLFDYKDIQINTTSSIGTEIKNCNVYLDMYGDLIILGELENTSSTIKTDIEITIDFIGGGSQTIHTAVVPVKPNYLGQGDSYPFHYYFTEKQKYIDIKSLKIGVNYLDYNNDFKGNPIAEIEEYFYEGDYLIIKGRVVNLGSEKIKDLRLLCTFYDSRDKVVFIKECFLPRERMMPGEVQEFTLKVLMDHYLQDFTHFDFEIFFEDEIRVNV